MSTETVTCQACQNIIRPTINLCKNLHIMCPYCQNRCDVTGEVRNLSECKEQTVECLYLNSIYKNIFDQSGYPDNAVCPASKELTLKSDNFDDNNAFSKDNYFNILEQKWSPITRELKVHINNEPKKDKFEDGIKTESFGNFAGYSKEFIQQEKEYMEYKVKLLQEYLDAHKSITNTEISPAVKENKTLPEDNDTPTFNVHFVCAECKAIFHNLNHLKKHIQMHKSKSNRTNLVKKYKSQSIIMKYYRCLKCGKSYRHPSSLNKHLKVCSCLKPYRPTTEEPQKNVIIKSSSKFFSCSVCNKSFNSLSQLTVHAKVHSTKKPHKCRLCGLEFYELQILKEHAKTHLEDNTVMNTSVIYSNLLPFECAECGREFTEPGNSTTNNLCPQLGNPRKCRKCNKSFSHSNAFKAHKRTHFATVYKLL